MPRDLNYLRSQAVGFYRDIGSVFCPYFKQEVSFTSEGLSHIKYRKSHQRHFNVQRVRYRLLKFAPLIIEKSNTLQEFDCKELLVKIRGKGPNKKILKRVRFFGFIAIIGGWKVKVIVRQIGNGNKHFWSVIPNWKTRKTSDGEKLLNYTGDLAFD